MKDTPMPNQTVTPATLKTWLDNNQAVLVDVREPAEFASEHIAGATLLPLGRVGSAALPAFAGRKLVITCRKGGRGQAACEQLRKNFGAATIYNLEGGIEAWEKAGLPLKTGARRVLPLDRQVQLTIGILLLTASLLGALYGRGFFLLTGFLGAGLSLAGLTGFCGLARVLGLMPWNRS
jgi:rhodanese-related sulfurtransferase